MHVWVPQQYLEVCQPIPRTAQAEDFFPPLPLCRFLTRNFAVAASCHFKKPTAMDVYVYIETEKADDAVLYTRTL